jgi:hypothetical protein
VRITQWAASFGANGSVASICAGSFDLAMQGIGNRVSSLFRPTCAAGPFAANGQPACRVIDQTASGGSALTQTALPNCADNGNVAPCWTAINDTTSCGAGKRVTINREASHPAGYLDSAFTCDPCAAGSTEIGCN